MADSIFLNLDLAIQRVLQLTQVPEELPSAGAIEIVDGNGTEPAAAAFTDRVRQRAQELASEVEKLRQMVAGSADALSQAAQSLQDTDTSGSAMAQNALSIVESASEPTAAPAQPAPTGGAAGVRSVLGGGPQ
ncbi:hypothetical protein SAMN04487848_0764 [Microbacterium sp. ru370.1]|uniref:Uncharacterized protein n=1 Tax=Microbacterium phycohabitans TaxID=3075993 RepID=A0ABU3SJE4_9MICO|nr:MULTISPECIES: hypothetical protein [unclassified Microbacterium]MDU0344919.1 hypothetical protein [Microbacterium sp. KSW2-29]SDO40269.1 hypothetical protein SAMN04487848_0764 [Microbacterium sp. ru370.1]SIT79554.1 hypothetical protein SAMN05880579_0760 [Microbacterium sp. RU1D]